jgi:hypothetical protein
MQPPAPSAFPPAVNAPPPGAGYYPPPVVAAKVMGDNTKWAIGLGIASLFCCGPLTGIIGFILAKKDMDEADSGRAPQLDGKAARIAYYLNIAGLVLFVAGLCLFWGRLGTRL